METEDSRTNSVERKGGRPPSAPIFGANSLSFSQHSVAEKVRTIRKYRSRPLCEYPGPSELPSRIAAEEGWESEHHAQLCVFLDWSVLHSCLGHVPTPAPIHNPFALLCLACIEGIKGGWESDHLSLPIPQA